MRFLRFGVFGLFVVAACGTPSQVCVPGKVESCACPGGGTTGVQTCNAEGSGFGACSGCGGAGGGGGSGGLGGGSGGGTAGGVGGAG